MGLQEGDVLPGDVLGERAWAPMVWSGFCSKIGFGVISKLRLRFRFGFGLAPERVDSGLPSVKLGSGTGVDLGSGLS